MLVPSPKNCDPSVRQAIQKLSLKLGPSAAPTLAGLTVTGLTASRIIATDVNKALASIDLNNWVAGTANEISITDDNDGTITIGIIDPLIVGKGGIGVATLTDHGILLGSGTNAVTPLGVASNGQLPIGSAGADPVLAVLTGTANQLIVTNAAGSITLSLPQDIHTAATPTFAGLISTDVIQATDFAKTGWPITVGATFSFSYPTFTVTDGGSAYYYVDGIKYTLGGNKTVNITDTEGQWYIYFDGATLTASQTIWSFRDEDKALVAILYWDATNNKEIFLGWEPHTFHMSGVVHARLHYAGGTRWETGLLVSDAGSELINVSAGDIWDEDLNIAISDGAGSALFEQVLSPAELPVYYRDGASAWRIYETTDKKIATDAGYVDGSNDLKYNKLNGTWANATVGLNNYVAYYVIATNEQTEPIALIMGQRVDNKLSDAKVNNIFSGLSLTGLPFQEMAVLARLILKDTGSGVYYTLEEVLDLRAYNIKGNITSPLITQHAGLGGLDFASAGHSGFQAFGAVLDDLNTLGAVGADSEFLVGTGAGTLAWESGATVRTSLGLGTGDSPTFAGLAVGTTTLVGRFRTVTAAGFNQNFLDCYSDEAAHYSKLWFRKSNSDTIGTEAVTQDGDTLGEIIFQGVDTHLGEDFDRGFTILATQDGAASGTYVPTKVEFYTATTDALNRNQLVLLTDGTVDIDTLVNLKTEAWGATTSNFNYFDCYSDDGAYASYLVLRKSNSDTRGLLTTTVDEDIIGQIVFQGVDNTPGEWDRGFTILVTQVSGAGVRVPVKAEFYTASQDALNRNQLVLLQDGNITMAGSLTLGTDLAITEGGTGQSTAQTAIDALSAVSGATNEHVLTKDTGTGQATWKAADDSGSLIGVTHDCGSSNVSLDEDISFGGGYSL